MKQVAYKYRIYPTREQQKLFANTFGCVRFVYNNLLDYRHKEFFQNNNSINYTQTAKRLRELKKEYTWLSNVSAVALQQSLRNLDKAFSNFFKGLSRYPKFKNKNAKQSFRLVNTGFSIRDDKLYIAKSKQPLKVKWSRKLDFEKINNITISKDCSGRYFVSIQGEKDIKPKQKLNKSIGLDLGLNHLVIDSDGKKYSNVRNTRKYANKLKREQRRLFKKQKGSNNRKKQRLKVAKVHAKIADRRKDYLHKLSSKLIKENQLICLEDLQVKNLIRNKKLSKHISDASWGELVSMMEYKADWYGRKVVKIDRFYPSSKTCSSCGHLHEKMPLSIRKFSCKSCGTKHDRDINAAKNVLAVGHTVIACGESNKTEAA